MLKHPRNTTKIAVSTDSQPPLRAQPPCARRGSVLQATFWATGIAGSLDIAYALGAHAVIGTNPVTILQAIASGVLGRDAYQGALVTAAIGLALHYGLMLIISYVFVAAAGRFAVLTTRPMISGSLYGLMVFAAMNYAIVPLSAAVPGDPPAGWLLAGAIAAHTILVGIPVALVARYYRHR